MTGEEGSPDGLTSLVQRVANAGEGKPVVTIADIVAEVGDGAFPPLLLVPALMLVSPLSGVPGMSIFLGLTMTLIALQMVLRRRHVWLPGFVTRRTIKKQRLERTMSALEKPARLVDRVTGRRLAYLLRGPLKAVPAIICLLAAMIVPFLEFVPFSSSLVAGAIALFAMSILLEDGLLFLIGLGILGSAGYLVWALAAVA